MSNDGERCHLIFNILRFSKNLSDVLDLELSDHDGELALPPRGAKIKVAIGWCDNHQVKHTPPNLFGKKNG